MSFKKFRKIDASLHMQPNVNQNPWLIVGIILMSVIVIMSAYAYFHKDEQRSHPIKQKELGITEK